MTYTAIKTAGQTIDYTWKLSEPSAGCHHADLESFCDEGRSFAVIRHEDRFSVYLAGIDSGLSDYRRRQIRISAAFCGLSEYHARRLLAYAIQFPDLLRERLVRSISRTAGKPDVEWDVDFKMLRSIFETDAEHAVVESSRPPFPDAWERSFSADGGASNAQDKPSDELVRLARELAEYSFSSGDGLKLLVSDAPSQGGYDKAVAEADRLLWRGAVERVLPRPPKNDPKPPTGLGSPQTTHSGGYPEFRRLISSNKGFLFFCGASLFLLALAFAPTRQCHKKKDDSQSVGMPADGNKVEPVNDKSNPTDEHTESRPPHGEPAKPEERLDPAPQQPGRSDLPKADPPEKTTPKPQGAPTGGNPPVMQSLAGDDGRIPGFQHVRKVICQ